MSRSTEYLGRKLTLRTLGLAAPALLLLAGAIGLRLTASRFFYGIETEQISAHGLAEDVPRLSAVMWTYFKALSATYGRGYLLPAYVLLLPAILLMAFRLSRARSAQPDSEAPASRGVQTHQRRFLIGVFVATFVAVTAVHFFVIHGYPQVSDEHSYIFEADLLASGRLYAESPPAPQFFQTLNIINDGRWYSRYTIGWPLLLALGRLARIDFAVNAACAALSLVVLYLIGKRLLGPSGGALSVFFAGLSPFFLLPAGTYFPHTASGLFSLIYVYCLLAAAQDGKWRHAVSAGVSIAYLLQIRPQDGVLVLVGTLPLALYLARRRPEGAPGAAGQTPARFALIMAFFALGVGALLLVNRAQTGQASLFAFLKYQPTEKWGFGTLGHSPLRGLWDAAYAFMRAGFWTVPFLTLLALISILRRRGAVALLVVPAAAFAAFYFFYYDLGGIDIGVRFYLPALLLLCVPAAGGVLVLKDAWQKTRRPGSADFVPSLVGLLAAFMVLAVFPPLVNEVASRFQRSMNLYRQTTRPPEIQGRSIIFLGEDPDRKNNVFTRNTWRLDRQANLMVFYLNPNENLEMIQRFPDRRPYLIAFNTETKGYEVTSQIDNSETPRNYLVAARNYRYGVQDNDRAEQAYLSALGLDPYNLNVYVELAGLYVFNRQYEKALPIYKAVLGTGQYPAVRYLLGRVLGEMGKHAEAIEMLQAFTDTWPDEALKAKASGWIEYYRSKLADP